MRKLGKRGLVRTLASVSLLVAAVLIASPIMVQAATDAEQQGLQGPVKLLLEGKGILTPAGQLAERLNWEEGTEFDPQGYISKTFYLNRDKSIEPGSETFREYQYKDGRLVRRIERRGNKITEESSFTYDRAGNLTKTESRFFGMTVIAEFNSAKHTSEVRIYSGNSLIGKTANVLDDKGRPVSMSIYGVQNKRSETREYAFDSEGRVTSSKWKTYDPGDKKNKVLSTTVYQYDRNGLESEKVSHDSNGDLLFKMGFTYEFDSRGNWTKKVTSGWMTVDGKSFWEPQSLVQREITYYE